MNIWHDISPKVITKEKFTAVIEIPKGSKVKYELDKTTGLLRMDRILYTSTHYPANYGFIPRTYAEDGDPLDVLVLCSETLAPLSLVDCYPIGVISMLDNGAADEKIICIPLNDPTYNIYKDISELPKHIFDEMCHFFSVYKALEHKDTVVDDVKDREHATEIVAQCRIFASKYLRLGGRTGVRPLFYCILYFYPCSCLFCHFILRFCAILLLFLAVLTLKTLSHAPFLFKLYFLYLSNENLQNRIV